MSEINKGVLDGLEQDFQGIEGFIEDDYDFSLPDDFDFSGLNQEEYEEDNAVSIEDATDITHSMESNFFDDYMTVQETELKYPYVVFQSSANAETLMGICKGILEQGPTQLYVQLSSDKPYLAIGSINVTPRNVQNLIRMSKKDSVYYRHGEDFDEILAKPEQFINRIDIPLNDAENEAYWNALLEEERATQGESETNLDDIDLDVVFGK